MGLEDLRFGEHSRFDLDGLQVLGVAFYHLHGVTFQGYWKDGANNGFNIRHREALSACGGFHRLSLHACWGLQHCGLDDLYP